MEKKKTQSEAKLSTRARSLSQGIIKMRYQLLYCKRQVTIKFFKNKQEIRIIFLYVKNKEKFI
jgi:hypothetical protein